jgi:large subunit ribosomal protein L1
MHGKNYNKVKEQVPAEAVGLDAAVDFLKNNVTGKFDQTVEVHIRLGVDPAKNDQMVRGSVQLPSGTPKQKKVAVFTADTSKQTAAKAAGATIVGGDELIAKILEDGSLDADVAVATPDMMAKIAKVARILGPKGLMPNPKTGTVAQDPEKVVAELAGGKVSFKMDSLGNIHEGIGKMSWDKEKIVANVEALVAAVRAARPATQKGVFVQGVYLKATMSPAIQLSI